MNLRSLSLSFLAACMLMGCSSHKTVLPYFTDLQATEGVIETMEYTPDIQPDDELMITINSSSPEATAHYNLPLSNPAVQSELKLATSPRQQTVSVDPEGNITLPVFGKIHVAGMSTVALENKLTDMVRKDVTDAIVRVQLVNFTVVVAGEVSKPQTIPVNRNRFSILDALGAAGDITPYGERSNVLVIREENGKRTFARLDLNSSDVLTSPYFYLKQNDYVYVEPNNVRQANSRYNQDNAYKLSVISTVVSAASVVASLVIALAIK